VRVELYQYASGPAMTGATSTCRHAGLNIDRHSQRGGSAQFAFQTTGWLGLPPYHFAPQQQLQRPLTRLPNKGFCTAILLNGILLMQ
jgi:hypothetical protein